MSTAAVLVTHNSARWIAETLTSVLEQQTAVDRIVIVDDHSTDTTLAIVREHAVGRPVEVIASAAQASDLHTRIASNFVQGVLHADADLVILGDHDDVWHPSRVGHQVGLLLQHPQAAMLASDGRILEQGGPTGRTIRDAFPVPAQFAEWRSSQQFAYAVRHSVATGGASALRPNAFPQLQVPKGWLHDRWWSLAAAANGLLVVDAAVVIDYRVFDGQQVGLATQRQDASAFGWLAHHGRQAVRSAQRAIDLAPLFMASR